MHPSSHFSTRSARSATRSLRRSGIRMDRSRGAPRTELSEPMANTYIAIEVIESFLYKSGAQAGSAAAAAAASPRAPAAPLLTKEEAEEATDADLGRHATASRGLPAGVCCSFHVPLDLGAERSDSRQHRWVRRYVPARGRGGGERRQHRLHRARGPAVRRHEHARHRADRAASP